MFDSHCHLTDLPDPLRALTSAHEVQVTGVLACGAESASNRALLTLVRSRLSSAHPAVWTACGLHPWFARQSVEEVLSLIERERPDVIGECGLEGRIEGTSAPPLEIQREVLEQQLELGCRLDLPFSLHSRQALPELLEVLANFPKARGALHAFSGSYELARRFLDRGWLLGFGGSITRPQAKKLRRLIPRLPRAGIVAETDAPAIGLLGIPPGRSLPSHLPRVIDALAQLLGLDPGDLATELDTNFERVFRLTRPF